MFYVHVVQIYVHLRTCPPQATRQSRCSKSRKVSIKDYSDLGITAELIKGDGLIDYGSDRGCKLEENARNEDLRYKHDMIRQRPKS